LSKIWKAANHTPVKKDNGAKDYCCKEETRVEGPWEFGEYLTLNGNKNAEIAEKIRVGNVLELVRAG